MQSIEKASFSCASESEPLCPCSSTPDILFFKTFPYLGEEVSFAITDPEDSIQKFYIYNEQFYEQQELEIIKDFVSPGRTIVDVGANYGNHTVYFARFMKAARVFPIEPNQHANLVLRHNVSMNGLRNVKCDFLGIAAGRKACNAKLILSEEHKIAHNIGGMSVVPDLSGDIKVVPLDDLFMDTIIDFVKIDVEGMELDVLSGMSKIVNRHRPLIFVEVKSENESDFRQWLDSFHYRIIACTQLYAGIKNYLVLDSDGYIPCLRRRINQEAARANTAERELALLKKGRQIDVASSDSPSCSVSPLRPTSSGIRIKKERLSKFRKNIFRVSRLPGDLLNRVAHKASETIVCQSLPFIHVERHGDVSGAVIDCRAFDVHHRAYSAAGRQSVSVIATCFNEEKNVARWMAAIASQTRAPGEIVIVDAGSTDGTAKLITAEAIRLGLPLQLFIEPGLNIAQGRNRAIENSSSEIIAVTDFGVAPDPQWLHEITRPFDCDDRIQAVAGTTRVDGDKNFQLATGLYFVPYIPSIDPRTFVPSSRSIAFARSAWREVGGYPEWLNLAGEDTHFAISLRHVAEHWGFSPHATVAWSARETPRALRLQAYSYGFGDGEAGLNPQFYGWDMRAFGAVFFLIGFGIFFSMFAIGSMGLLTSYHRYAICLTSLAFAITALRLSRARLRTVQDRYRPPQRVDADSKRLYRRYLPHLVWWRVRGFVNGYKHRLAASDRRFLANEGLIIILSGVEFTDSGGGQRPTMMAKAFARLGYRVIFLNYYPRYEHHVVHVRAYFNNIELFSYDSADWEYIWHAVDLHKTRSLCIVEYPQPRFIQVAKKLKKRGCMLAYDCIDDWESSLGGDWFLPTTELKFARMADFHFASAQILMRHLENIAGKRVVLVPNAVDQSIFKLAKYDRPADLPSSKPIVLYVGALWGEWFDWELLVQAADHLSHLNFVIVGDWRGQTPLQQPNVFFLGLKPQAELPSYMAHADVGIIPFRRCRLVDAVSPLKAFEYRAMGLPVVATDMPEMYGIEGVEVANSESEFITLIQKLALQQKDCEGVCEFIAKNNWEARCRVILDTVLR